MSASALEVASLSLGGQRLIWMGGNRYQSNCVTCGALYEREVDYVEDTAKELLDQWSDECVGCSEVAS